jgi:hypothetical protein
LDAGAAPVKRRLPHLLLALYVSLVPLSLLVRGPEPDNGEPFFLLAAMGFPVVGALIASRRPDNPIGWLLLALGIVFGAGLFADSYVETGATALAGVMGWYGSVALLIWLPLGVVFLPLLFPDGRLLSPRWRWAVRLTVAAVVLGLLATGLKPGPLDTNQKPDIVNPFGVPALKGLLEVVNVVGEVLLIAAIAAAVSSVVVRFRRSHGEARLQLKWFAWVGSVMIVAFLVAAVTAALGDDSPVAFLGNIGWPVGLLCLIVGIPVATGIAVLRYRLYEIDVVINRTLVYGLLTATLAAAYLGSVLLLQLAVDPLTSNSSLAVAVSTLAVAALFRPARRRIQGVVDRRFYRRKYDAARTLEGFSSRLREQVDLEALGSELRNVVHETMQPAHVSLWIRSPGR